MEKPTRAVYIRWQDSMGPDGWTWEIGVSSIEHSAIGWLMGEDAEEVVVSHASGGRTPEGSGKFSYTALSALRIPRRAIIRMQVWKPPAWVILE